MQVSEEFVTEAGIRLSDEQIDAVKTVLDFLDGPKYSLILTGRAGSGKTTVTNYLREILGDRVVVCATTGRAALHAGGTTVDRLFNINRNTWQFRSKSKLYDIMMGIHQNSDVIIIDEASMIGRKMAELINEASRMCEKKIILVGDWAQAQPVKDELDLGMPLFYEAEVVKLQECRRQNDQTFLDALDSVRRGEVTRGVEDVFMSRDIAFRNQETSLEVPDEVVVLMSTNASVYSLNMARLQEHAEQTGNMIYSHTPVVSGKDGTSIDPVSCTKEQGIEYERAIANSPCDSQFDFSIGCHVMITMNSNRTSDEAEAQYDDSSQREDTSGFSDCPFRYVNGDTGRVVKVSIVDPTGIFQPAEADVGSSILVWVQLDRNKNIVCVRSRTFNFCNEKDEIISSVYGVPIRLAYAVTIHKSQGSTIPKVLFDMSTLNGFPNREGLAYVALSRVRQLEDLFIYGWNANLVSAPEDAKSLL